MGTLKNISGEPLDVPLLRRTVGLGDDGGGEEIEVDDSLLTNSGLVWPAGTWLVNGASHEHDPNSPENTAKREADDIPVLTDGADFIAGAATDDQSLPTAGAIPAPNTDAAHAADEVAE